MPLYEYTCRRCGETTEFLESAGSEGAHSCNHCGSSDLRRAYSSFSARVSGTSPGPNAARPPACASCTDSSCAIWQR